MINRRRIAISILAMGLTLGASPLMAQTPVTAVGLGVPVPAIDARSAALGGTGLGLLGGSLSARNPADMGFFDRPVLGLTLAPEAVSVKGPGGELDTGRSRIGILRGAIPFNSWTLGVAFASELDQDWEVVFNDTLSSSLGTFPYVESRQSNGGVSSVNFTATRKIGRISIGAEYGVLTGSRQVQFLREFEADTADVSNRIGSSTGATGWSYAGSRVRIGAAADVTDRLRVSADVSFQGDLTAERDSADVIVTKRTFSMPAAFEAGATARVTPRVLVSAAAGWTGWEGAENESTTFVASNVIWMGVGAELTGTRLLGANIPLRLGFRRSDLPFHAPGTAQPSETAVTLGFGVRVSDEQARLDVALEIGSRGDL